MRLSNADTISQPEWDQLREELISRLATGSQAGASGPLTPDQVVLAQEQVATLYLEQTRRLARLGTSNDFEPSTRATKTSKKRLASSSAVGRRFVNSLLEDARLVADLALTSPSGHLDRFTEYLAWMVSMASEPSMKRRSPFALQDSQLRDLRQELGLPLGAMAREAIEGRHWRDSRDDAVWQLWVTKELQPAMAGAEPAVDDLESWSEAVIRAGAIRLRELSGDTQGAG